MTAVYRLLKTGKCPTSLRLQHMKLLIDYFEGCPFGDQPGIISNEQTTCKGSVLAKPFLCYDEQTALMCCKSCSLHYRSKPGCEYGDKEGKCSSINLLHCLFDESTCCETYAQLDKTLSALRLPVFITCVLLVLLTIAVITHCIRRKSQNKGHRQTNENCVDTLPTNDVSNTCCLASAADSKSENIVSNRKRTPVGQSSFEMKPSTRETIGYDIQADENEAPDPTNDFTERGNAQQIMIDRFLSNWNKYIDNNGKQLTESRYIPSSEADLSVVQPTGTRNSRIWSIDML
ncbi:uncharacterized protein LOC123539218 [Mercenaria mercenaria]|uniref:uncharacterized protein LOC123539218 n=1 Tax=Mercenaria mercenaria TaxID=6596 RepID=UPI00234E9371|nr:uncharacterized protein LOC123539218 [Mercenaria mercenaria]